MKKIYILLAIFFAFNSTNAQNRQHTDYSIKSINTSIDKNKSGKNQFNSYKTDTELLDTIIIYNTSNELLYRETRSFDAAGNILNNLGENWINGLWINSIRHLFTYDVNGNLLTELDKSYNNDSTWIRNQRYTYTYDANGKELSFLFEVWLNNSWVNDYRDTYTYDASGKELSCLREGLLQNSWGNEYRFTYTYDDKENILTEISENWINYEYFDSIKYTYNYDNIGNKVTELFEHFKNSVLVDYHRYTFTYNSDGKELTMLHSIWPNNTWVNSDRNIFTYDTNGNLLSELDDVWTDDSLWVSDQRYTYVFDNNGNELSKLHEIYRGNTWSNFERSSFSYNTNREVLTTLNEHWQDTIWITESRSAYTYSTYGKALSYISEEPGAKLTFTYDANGNVLIELDERTLHNSFNGFNWQFITRYTFTYDAHGNTETGKYERLDLDKGEWLPFDSYFGRDPIGPQGIIQPPATSFQLMNSNMVSKTYRYVLRYISLTALNIINTFGKRDIVIYPNPANDMITIDLHDLGDIQKMNILIYDLQGHVLMKQNIKQEITEIRLDHVKAGIYILEIFSNTSTLIKKFIKK